MAVAVRFNPSEHTPTFNIQKPTFKTQHSNPLKTTQHSKINRLLSVIVFVSTL
jgi:hypothetical protein